MGKRHEAIRRWSPRSGAARARGKALVGVASSLFFCGCSSFDGGSDVLALESLSGSSAPGEPGSDWSCLTEAATTGSDPLAVANGAGRVTYSARVIDFTTRQVASDIAVRACVLTDVTCAQPVSSKIPVNADGWFDLPVYQGFVGYLEFSGGEYFPAALYLTEPLQESLTLDFPVPMVNVASLAALGSVIGVTIDPGGGLMTFRVFDCQGVTAKDVVLNKEGDGVQWYFADGLPTRTAAQTGIDGFGGWVNVSPGVTAVDARAPNGLSIVGQQSLVVRPGWGSSAYIWPRGSRPRSAAMR